MMNFEEELNIKKVEIDTMDAPVELEDRLRRAIDSADSTKVKNRKPFKKLVLAAAVVLLVTFGALNYDVFAYYGKKILGYDEVTFGSIKELNTMGMGQEINKTYTFKNGTLVTLDGVMLDDNKLIAMYSIKGDNEEKIQNLQPGPLEGFWGRYIMTSGRGLQDESGREIKWVQEYQVPSPFDRDLTFTISSSSDDISRGEAGRISFKLDLNKAVKCAVKCNINQVVESKGTKYSFNTLSATPLSVVIEGSVYPESLEEQKLYAGRDILGQRRSLDIELVEMFIKDGKVVTEKLQQETFGLNTGIGGINFDFGFDGIKPGMQSLTLNFVKIQDTRVINKTVSVNSGMKDVRVVPDTDEITIKDVKVDGGNTVVVFEAQRDVTFDTALMIGGRQIKTLDISSSSIDKNGRNLTEKTYTFEGSGSDMKLMFKTLSHETYINKEISIYGGK